ncbi:MAG: MmgE/PrpD family protein [Chloroflexi bacterium]|nr:MmgE/PrpD family protein [Chloroflexota bacterium]
MPVRDQLARFCYDLKFEDLPRDVLKYTRLMIADQVGLTTAAARIDPEVDTGLGRFFKELGGKEESSLVGEGCKVPSINAAFANTALSFGGFDGLHRAAIHLPSTLIPGTMAVAEREKASGKDLILATVIGAEVMTRIGMAMGASNAYNRGFHPTSLCAPFGVAVAGGKLLRLSRDAFAEAISIAAVQGAGARPWPQFPKAPLTTRVQVGRAAHSGVMSALLAGMGIIGIADIFEDARGFLTGHSAKPDIAQLTRGLGTEYEIKNTTLKNYCVGIYNIPCIEALLSLVQKHHIRGEDIAHITCKLPTEVVPLVGSPAYPSRAFSPGLSKSARYILAVTAYQGDGPTLFSLAYKNEANLKDPRHAELFKKIDVEAGPELDKFFPGKWPCSITIKTRAGQEFSQFHDGSVKGSPENPLTQQEMENRFNKVVAPVLSQERCDRMMAMLRRLEEVTDVSPLASLMAGM